MSFTSVYSAAYWDGLDQVGVSAVVVVVVYQPGGAPRIGRDARDCHAVGRDEHGGGGDIEEGVPGGFAGSPGLVMCWLALVAMEVRRSRGC